MLKDKHKTLTMRILEQQFQTPIEELIAYGDSLKNIAAELGLDISTISKWRKQLLNHNKEL